MIVEDSSKLVTLIINTKKGLNLPETDSTLKLTATNVTTLLASSAVNSYFPGRCIKHTA
uniref:Uncharacterized protein n=1 Tax=Anguilla anguilla TaxID=7936 RepID=A0A0E9R4I3_ANGAN